MAIEDKDAKGTQRIGNLPPAIIKPERKPLSRIRGRRVWMPRRDEEVESILQC